MIFSKKSDPAFTTTGFANYKKAIEKFEIYEKSDSHNEAMVKIAYLKGPLQLSSQVTELDDLVCC